jgi:hypothetical protein
MKNKNVNLYFVEGVPTAEELEKADKLNARIRNVQSHRDNGKPEACTDVFGCFPDCYDKIASPEGKASKKAYFDAKAEAKAEQEAAAKAEQEAAAKAEQEAAAQSKNKNGKK